jgi:hypothetical protein
MKEVPMLFDAESVRGILDGAKRQTRRLVKFDKMHTDFGEPNPEKAWIDLSYMKPEFGNVPCLKVAYGKEECVAGETVHRHFPKAEPGDTIWGKETFSLEPKRYCGDKVVYRADGKPSYMSWKPSIFMPRKFSRLLLRVTEVRVQRVQDISTEDCIAEGIEIHHSVDGCDFYREYGDPEAYCNEVGSFESRWEMVNGKGAWDRNEWVWCYTFERIT